MKMKLNIILKGLGLVSIIIVFIFGIISILNGVSKEAIQTTEPNKVSLKIASNQENDPNIHFEVYKHVAPEVSYRLNYKSGDILDKDSVVDVAIYNDSDKDLVLTIKLGKEENLYKVNKKENLTETITLKDNAVIALEYMPLNIVALIFTIIAFICFILEWFVTKAWFRIAYWATFVIVNPILLFDANKIRIARNFNSSVFIFSLFYLVIMAVAFTVLLVNYIKIRNKISTDVEKLNE